MNAYNPYITIGLGALLLGACSGDDSQLVAPGDDFQRLEQALVSHEAWGFVWADCATGSCVASPSYSRNSTGDALGVGVDNKVENLGVGRYRVTLPGLGDPAGGTVQVTAYGSGNERCKVENWGGSPDLVVAVRCHTPAGALVNTRFTLAYVLKEGLGTTDEAYLWADSPTSPSYTPSLAYQFNSSGESNTITRSGTGRYTALLPHQQAIGATVQVTAYGSGSEYCKAAAWYQSGNATAADVRCFDTRGNPADARFVLNYARDTPPLGALSYSYAWADQPSAASYTPSLSYQKGDVAGSGDVATDISIRRGGTGQYLVDLPGMSPTGSNAQVTSYGFDSTYCKVVNWLTTVTVACFNASGAAADAFYVVGYSDDLFVPSP